MVEIPNPWMSLNSEADNSHALDAGAAPTDPGRSAAPVPIDLDATNHINEIFWFVRNKLGERRAEDFVDLDALEAAIDPLPLFLRAG
jgi:hypothetical protein